MTMPEMGKDAQDMLSKNHRHAKKLIATTAIFDPRPPTVLPRATLGKQDLGALHKPTVQTNQRFWHMQAGLRHSRQSAGIVSDGIA